MRSGSRRWVRRWEWSPVGSGRGARRLARGRVPLSPPPVRRATSSDRGSATVWTVGAIAMLCVVFGAVLSMGHAVLVRHRAAGAADLAALAAADHWSDGGAAACARAERVAQAQGARLVRCEVEGQISDVTAASGSGLITAEVRARAGPPGPTEPSPSRAVPVSSGSPDLSVPSGRPSPSGPPVLTSRPDLSGRPVSTSWPGPLRPTRPLRPSGLLQPSEIVRPCGLLGPCSLLQPSSHLNPARPPRPLAAAVTHPAFTRSAVSPRFFVHRPEPRVRPPTFHPSGVHLTRPAPAVANQRLLGPSAAVP
ncbi:Rv3654c family TadE-like protein [Streptomyces sp. NPDC127038]|uniref:Rv3654c family TadE-like protein n=1 Tax=Streptomyces sp. NPDC127038 TaxID=3347114 RepID=UPI00364AC884